jgi:hypothetical protein
MEVDCVPHDSGFFRTKQYANSMGTVSKQHCEAVLMLFECWLNAGF